MDKPRILNAHIDKIPTGSVYVDRSSKYGNPYKLGVDGDFEQVKKLYIQYLIDNPALIEDIKLNLKGKDLVCWCVPDQRCHAELLLIISNDPDFELNSLL